MKLLLRHQDTSALALIVTLYIEMRVAGAGNEAKGIGLLAAMFVLGKFALLVLHFIARRLQP